ncbi:class I mannose-6-phosphate isomerase [Enterococcus xiangfangensis]|uniref:class I mannose-6-phosphate isomerase n=1 Tax=Enterococcus xiangfangensis TaxID=1296537 RepID=UPI0010F67B6E|nr:class I mannose-6-phosphate isomerase [Enterococcus xiangfangensis]MBM7711184.1 mannose-6-phosphate isomerase [Enterococcus xiangfangensis]NBK09246.1 mannose-6-phosphate isomerase [Enterococcus asini]
MYILEPESRERIWGTPRLHDYSGNHQIEKIGSVYSASGVSEIDCKIVNEEQTFSQMITDDPKKFGLEAGEVYPLIISFTACDENLSIQVHPTDDYARRIEHMPYGKSEAWYFITPPKDGWIYAEQEIPEKSAISEAAKKNEYTKILREYSVNRNDLIYIPSGTIHALTKGSLVYEIQQATDITYRFYDYDRKDKSGQKRELHVDKAIETLHPEQHVEKNSFVFGETVAQREFTIRHLKGEQIVVNESEIASILTILTGEIIINEISCKTGQSIVLLKDERLEIPETAEVVLATPKRYWKK